MFSGTIMNNKGLGGKGLVNELGLFLRFLKCKRRRTGRDLVRPGQ